MSNVQQAMLPWDFPILQSPPLEGTLADTITAALSTASKLGVAYWTGQTAVATQQALYQQAKAGGAAAQGAGAAAAQLQNYVPYIIGAGALVTLAIVLTRSK